MSDQEKNNTPDKVEEKKAEEAKQPSKDADVSLHALLSAERTSKIEDKKEDSGLFKLKELAKEISEKKDESAETMVTPSGTSSLRPSIPPSPAGSQEPGCESAEVRSSNLTPSIPPAAVPQAQPVRKGSMQAVLVGIVLVLAVALTYLLTTKNAPPPSPQAVTQVASADKSPDPNAQVPSPQVVAPPAPGSEPAQPAAAVDTGTNESAAKRKEPGSQRSQGASSGEKTGGDTQGSVQGSKELSAILDKPEEKSPGSKTTSQGGATKLVDGEKPPIAGKADEGAAPSSETKPPAQDSEDQIDSLLTGGVDKKPAAPKMEVAAAVDDGIPDKLSREQINEGMRSISDKVRSCSRYGTGTVNVEVTIGNNGKVSSAKPLDAFANTPAGNCVAMMVRTARFPVFKRPTIVLTYPFVL